MPDDLAALDLPDLPAILDRLDILARQAEQEADTRRALTTRVTRLEGAVRALILAVEGTVNETLGGGPRRVVADHALDKARAALDTLP